MKLKIAFQMDPISDVDINGDTSFRLAEEGQKRGHEIYYFNPESLVYEIGNIIAHGQKVGIERGSTPIISLEKEKKIDLSEEVDVVFLRQDPPFDMLYITTTFLLERLKGKTLVLNDPYWVRNSPEKLLVLDFLDLMPPTVITRSLQSIIEFRKRYKDIILGMPIIKSVPKRTFYKWLKSKGKLGGQNKVPRLNNSRQYLDDILKIVK